MAIGRAFVAASSLVLLAWCVGCGESPAQTGDGLVPEVATAPVANDPDDPAVWIDRRRPSQSLLLGTNKVAAPEGALYVFGLDGTVRQTVGPLDRPNNVDVEYGLATPEGPIDIVVLTERLQHRLRVYSVANGRLAPLDGSHGIPVLEGQAGEAAEPMGIALYRRPSDGIIYAIVAPKSGGSTQYLWQYRLDFDQATGAARGTLVRRFGNYSGTSEIEAVAVDDALSYVYYSDEEHAIRKWHADPDHPEAASELAVFGQNAFVRQREGIGIFARPDGSGYLAVSDQTPNGTKLVIFPRAGRPGQPHAHDPAVAVIPTPADNTDGLEIVASGLDGIFSDGLLVMMNSAARNFLLFKWSSVASAFGPSADRQSIRSAEARP